MKLLCTLFAAFCVFLPLHADDAEKNPIDVALDAALDKETTTPGIVGAYTTAMQKWDKDLNATYKQLKAKMEEEAWSTLVETQKAWIAFRDAQIAQLKAFYGKKDGTMWRINLASQLMELTKDRAVFLKSLLTDSDQ